MLVVFGLAATYLVAMNVFLQTRLFRSLFNFDPEAMLLDYTSAYSAFPGRIHVEGLTLRGSDDQVQWILGLDRCDFTVQFLDLLHRQFHTSRVRGDGLTFYVRLRVPKVSRKHVAALPGIPGFENPPMTRIGPPTAPLTDATYKLWGVDLENVVASHVRDLWIDTLRYQGDVRIEGRWAFRPVRFLDVGPATVSANGLEISYGAMPLVKRLAGAIVATVHPFDLRVPTGMGILRNVSVVGDMEGEALTSHFLEAFVGRTGVSFDPGDGSLALGLSIDHGRIREGTHGSLESPDSRVQALGVDATANLRTVFTVDAATPSPLLRLLVDGADLVVSRGAASVSVKRLDVTLSARELDLAQAPFGDTTFAADVAGMTAVSLSPWISGLPAFAGVTIHGDPLHANAHLEGSFAAEQAHGTVGWSDNKLSVERGREHITAGIEGELKVARASLRERTFDLSGSHVEVVGAEGVVHGVPLRARAISLRAPHALIGPSIQNSAQVTAEFSRVEIPDLAALGPLVDRRGNAPSFGGRVWASGRAEMRFPERQVRATEIAVGGRLTWNLEKLALGAKLLANVEGEVRDWNTGTVELLRSDVSLRDVTGRVETDGGPTEVVSIPALSAKTDRLSLSRTGEAGRLSVDLPHADFPQLQLLQDVMPMPPHTTLKRGAGTARGHFALDMERLTATGTAELVATQVAVQLAAQALDGTLVVHIDGKERGDATDVSGSFVAFEGTRERNVDPWWGHAELKDSQLTAKGGLQLQATLRVVAKNASPAAAVIAANTSIPRWVLNVIPLIGLQADGELRLDGSSLELRDVVARGKGDSVRFEYTSCQEQTRWAVLAEEGLMSVGIGGGTFGSSFVLFGAAPWFDQKVPTVRGALGRESCAANSWPPEVGLR